MELRTGIKLIGLGCIFGACVLSGFRMEQTLKQKWLFWKELQEVFLLMEKEMIFHQTAVSDALWIGAQNCTTCLKDLFLHVSEEVKKNTGEVFEKVWQDSIDKMISDKLVKECERKLLYDTASALSGNDKMMQEILLSRNQERFRECGNTARSEYQEKGKLIRSLMTAAGIFLVILLI